jgi:hypothetical protein
VKNYLGHGAGLAAVIRAVVHGALLPAGRTTRFGGITGYLFRSEHLRRYRSAPEITAPLEGFPNYREAAALLEVRTDVVRGLPIQGLLAALPFRNGFAKLIPANEVQQFAERYLAVSVLARRSQLDSGSLTRYLKELNIRLLAIPLPDAGRGHVFFLSNDVAAQIQLPSRDMLREAAQYRIVAARKKQWAEYRQAKEIELGRPMRRVRPARRPSDNGAR